jgi:CDP-diacylglycerol--glycerol-3-phosphate 3-phosphatidyltransferase
MLSPEHNAPETFTDLLRRIFRNVLEKIAGFFNQLGIKPNTITVIGLLGNLAAGVLIALGQLLWGGLMAMVMGPLDALDGVMARLRNESGKYGAFLDSVSDRYSEIFLYGGLIIYFIRNQTPGNTVLVFFAAVGSIMVSYTRAKAEAAGLSAKIGLLTRAERYIVLIPGLLFGYPFIALWILAILTNFTAFQRIWFVLHQINLEKNQS